MGTKETLVDLRAFETGLSMYQARLKACWTREWHITQEEEALVSTDRARLQRAYGALRAAIAQANGGVVPHFGYGNMDLGEIGHVALGDPDNDSSVMDALDKARQMVAQAIGYFEHVEREESRNRAANVTPRTRSGGAPPAQPAGHRSPRPRGWAEACIALGALVVTYALQPYVYPPPDQWRTPIAVAGAIVSLIGIVLLLVGRAPGRDGAAGRRAAVGGGGHGARQASNVTGSGNTVTQAARDVIGVQNIHNIPPVHKTRDETARQRDIAFAHRLNEKYEDGVHRILNYPFQSEQAVFKFKELAEAWTDDVVKDLRAHPCTPHEITRFRVLQEVPRDKHFHPDPAWDDLKQQFNERLNRLRLLIERYEKPPA